MVVLVVVVVVNMISVSERTESSDVMSSGSNSGDDLSDVEFDEELDKKLKEEVEKDLPLSITDLAKAERTNGTLDPHLETAPIRVIPRRSLTLGCSTGGHTHSAQGVPPLQPHVGQQEGQARGQEGQQAHRARGRGRRDGPPQRERVHAPPTFV